MKNIVFADGTGMEILLIFKFGGSNYYENNIITHHKTLIYLQILKLTK